MKDIRTSQSGATAAAKNERENGTTEPVKGALVSAFRKVRRITAQQRVLKVLVIEDDKLARLMLCSMLRSLGFQTLEAADGYKGMQMFRQERPDLVVTDILMPDKEGLETIMDIRALDAQVPIVAMSGGGGLQNMSFLAMARKFGATRTMSKPFMPGQMADLISSLTEAEYGPMPEMPQFYAGNDSLF